MPMTITTTPSSWVIQAASGALEPGAQLAEHGADQHEDHRETQDKQPDAGKHPAAPLLLQVDAGQAR